MADDYQIYYLFEAELADVQIEDLVRVIDDNCAILWPEPDDIETLVELLAQEGRSIVPTYKGTEFSVRIDDGERVGLPAAVLKIDEQFILPTHDDSVQVAVDRMREFYGFLGRLYDRFVSMGADPRYVFGLNFVEPEGAFDPAHDAHVSATQILDAEPPGVFWFQIFPPTMVDALDREHVRSTPAVHLEERPDGAVLLATSQGIIGGENTNLVDDAAAHLDLPYVQ